MTKRTAFVVGTILASAVAARPASAQAVGAACRFIDVAVGGAYGDSPMPGIVPSAGIAAGVMNERHGLQVEFSVSGSHVQNSGPWRYRFTFPDSQYWKLGHLYEDSVTMKTRALSATALYAHRIPTTGSVHATFLAGGGMVSTPYQSTFVTKEVLADGSLAVVHADRVAATALHLVAALGVDADVRVSRRLSIVPSVRVLVFPVEIVDDVLDHSGSGQRMLVTPQVSVRWRF